MRPASTSASSDSWSVRPRDQRTLVIVLLLATLIGTGRQWRETGGHGVDIDHHPPPPLPLFVVNVNAAEAGELKLVPRVGDKLAQRILDARSGDGPFENVQQLDSRVRGIGTRTLDEMRPFLTPIGDK